MSCGEIVDMGRISQRPSGWVGNVATTFAARYAIDVTTVVGEQPVHATPLLGDHLINGEHFQPSHVHCRWCKVVRRRAEE